MESETLWGLMAVTFLAAFIQSSTGFGFGLVAVPAFLILLDSLSAVPIISALTVLVGVIVIPPLIKHTPVKLLSVALAAMVVGVPVGLLFYAYADVATAKVVTGVIIVVLASMLVLRDLGLRVRWPWGTAEGRAGVGGLNAGSTGDASVAGVAVPSATMAHLASDVPAPPYAMAGGFAAGVLGAALAMPGLPIMLYLAKVRLNKDAARACALIVATLAYAAVAVLHAALGNYSMAAMATTLELIPAVLIGALVGHFAAKVISEAVFRVLVIGVLLTSGLYAVVSALL